MQVSNSGDAAETAARPARRRGAFLANGLLGLVSILIAILVAEIGYRVANGLPVFKLTNWRTANVMTSRIGELNAIVDPVLGWTLKPWSAEDIYTRIAHGIRPNFGETTIRTGSILAVGDSFTEGWEVDDDETWPAFVEKLAGVPVVNAGVGGYGADQTTLRAEQLLPIVKPKILMLGFHEAAIIRTGYSVHGVPKPHFTLENGELRYHPPEPIVAQPLGAMSLNDRVREVLGYFAALDYVLARLNPNYWYSMGSQWLYRKENVNETDVTCALLRRLKTQTDRDDIRLMLFIQYYAGNIIGDNPTRNSQRVRTCADAAGIRVVDHFESLRAIETARQNAMFEYYTMNKGLFGHMTAKGNEHAGNLLTAALRDWLPAITDRSQVASPLPEAK